MRVFRVSPLGARYAVPVPFRAENRYAFFHGGEGSLSWKYCLRLSKGSFPVNEMYHWEGEEFALLRASPTQWDEFGNLAHVLRRSMEFSTGECVALLDMCLGEKGIGVLHSWNEYVRTLGHGAEMRPVSRHGIKGARRSVEIDYPALVCRAGAEFFWEWNGQFVGAANYAARWDGVAWNVVPQVSALPDYAEEHLVTRGWLRL